MKRISRQVFALTFAAVLSAAQFELNAAPAITGAYSSSYSLQTIAVDPTLLHADQLAFNPADPTHLYVARVSISDSQFGSIVRYDYNVSGGVTSITNPLTVATLEQGFGPVGLAFWQGKLIFSATRSGAGIPGTDSGGAYTNEGRIGILTANPDGTFGSRIDFAYGIHSDYHQADQLRIVGNTLYIGIGTRDNGGLSSSNAAYNGTIARIADLTQTNFTDSDHNGVTEVNALASNYTTIAGDGMLRLYASGFRNPFGLHVTPAGKVWVADNGRDNYNGDTVTPDLLYKELPAGASGIFPSGSGSVSPLANLGNETAATGLVVLAQGADIGDALVTRYRNAGAQGGADVVLVDSVTGQVNLFANGFAHPIDSIIDPFGRVLLVDFGVDSVNGGLYLVSLPEPAALSMLALGGLSLLLRRRAANQHN